MKSPPQGRTLCIALFLAVVAAPLSAAQQATPQPTLTAVVDINHIFANHARFKEQMKQLKADVENFEKEVNTQRQAINEERKKLDMFHPQSREYKQLEENIARRMSEIQVRAQLKRKEIVEREARHYYEAYLEIQAIVRQLADTHNIALVLRFDSSEIDPQDRDSVIKGVNQSVIFQRNLDITQLVLQQINPPTSRF